MKIFAGHLLAIGVFIMASISSPAAAPKDEAAIAALLESMSLAWDKGDAHAFAAKFAEDGSFTNVLGSVYYGHQAFEERHAQIFATIFKGSTTKLTIGKLRFVRPDVAVADLDAELRDFATLPPVFKVGDDKIAHSKLLMVLVKEHGSWWITAFHNVAVTPMPPRCWLNG